MVYWLSGGKTRCPIFHGPFEASALPPRGGGWRGALPYLAYTETCHWIGYDFWPLCPEQGIQGKVARLSSLNMVCLKQGPKIEGAVPLSVSILGLCWDRFPYHQRHPYIQTLVKCRGGGGHVVCSCHVA